MPTRAAFTISRLTSPTGRADMAKISKGFSLDTEKDADIIAFLDDQENTSETVRKAIRAFMLVHSGPTLGDVLQELGEIKRMLRAGVSLATDDGDQGAEAQAPADPLVLEVESILDGLGK